MSATFGLDRATFGLDRATFELDASVMVGTIRAAGRDHVIIDVPGDKHGHVLQTPPWRLVELSSAGSMVGKPERSSEDAIPSRGVAGGGPAGELDPPGRVSPLQGDAP